MTSNKFFRVQVDIFGVPVEYTTADARQHGFYRVVNQLINLGISFDSSLPFVHLLTMVTYGFLSIRSASYFLIGRTTFTQEVYFEEFVTFWDSYLKSNKSFCEILKLWQKQENVVPENTFLFPLAELASKDEDFSSDINGYREVSILDLKEI